jgi:hypothetical protein
MIIHSPIVSGSLTFANGATITLPQGSVYSGSFSGSYAGASFIGGTFTGIINSTNGVVSGSSQVSYPDLSNIPAGIISSSAQIDTIFNIDNLVSSSTQVTALLPTGTISGSSQVDLTLTTNYASGIKTQLDSNTVVSGSSQITISSTTGYSTFSSSLDGRIVTNTSNVTELYSSASLHANKFTTLATLSGSIQTKNDTLGTYTASLETKNSTLATYTGSIDSKFSTLGTYTASLETKNSTLASVTGSLLSSQTNLNTYTGSLLNAFQVTGSKVNFLGDITIYGTQSIINSQNVEIADNILYLAPTASIDNDLGVVGHYNDGTYRHAGIFMDASDGHSWKVFNGLQGETSATIDTAGTGFTLADFKAGAITGTSFTGTINATNGVVSGSSQIVGSAITTNSVTVTAGTGLSGGGAVALGSSVTLSNAGVTSNVAGTGVSVSGATGAVTISIGQAVATTSNVQFNSLGIGMAASATAGRIDATNDIVAYSSSDIRFKENITPIQNALDKINQIGGYTYDWKEEHKIEHGYEGNDVGVIAQEIEEVLPQLVQTRESGYKAVKYDKLVALLIEGIKEQQFQIDGLKAEIEALKK